jgi:hypothetical protein
LESEPLCSVADLFLAKRVDASVDFLVRYGRFEPLDAHEILIVEGAEPVDRDLQLRDQSLELRRIHEPSLLR